MRSLDPTNCTTALDQNIWLNFIGKTSLQGPYRLHRILKLINSKSESVSDHLNLLLWSPSLEITTMSSGLQSSDSCVCKWRVQIENYCFVRFSTFQCVSKQFNLSTGLYSQTCYHPCSHSLIVNQSEHWFHCDNIATGNIVSNQMIVPFSLDVVIFPMFASISHILLSDWRLYPCCIVVPTMFDD